MTNLYFTFAANPPRKDGSSVIKMYLAVGEPTRTDSPGDERRAMRDVRKIVGDICNRANLDPRNDEGLLSEEAMPGEADPVFVFAIGVTWDRESGLPSYKKIGYRSVYIDGAFARVASVGMELFGYTFGVLRKRERDNRSALHLPKFKPDKITVEHALAQFDEFTGNLRYAHTAYLINKIRFDCPNLRNGYCTPSKPMCQCYANGRCVEMTAARIGEKVRAAKNRGTK